MRTIILAAAATGVFAVQAAAGQPAVGKVYTKKDGVVLPVVVKEVKPQHTPSAIKAQVQGSVLLECVVRTDGTVSDVRVLKPLRDDLDQESVKALKQWRFKPGAKDGKPVPVKVEIEMTFKVG